MDTINPTRRSALGILATGPIALLPALAVMQCSAPADAATSTGFAQVIERYRSTSRDVVRFDSDILGPALKAFRDECDSIPHVETVNGYANVLGDKIHLSTVDKSSVAVARRAISGKGHERDADYWATVRELIEAADGREALIAEASKRHNIEELRKLEEDYSEADIFAFDALVEYPVASLADLRVKIELIEEGDAWTFPAIGKVLIADVRRIVEGR